MIVAECLRSILKLIAFLFDSDLEAFQVALLFRAQLGLLAQVFQCLGFLVLLKPSLIFVFEAFQLLVT